MLKFDGLEPPLGSGKTFAIPGDTGFYISQLSKKTEKSIFHKKATTELESRFMSGWGGGVFLCTWTMCVGIVLVLR